MQNNYRTVTRLPYFLQLGVLLCLLLPTHLLAQTSLRLTAPTYKCTTGAITFNTMGGDGSLITYSAPGITRSSLSSSTGVVEQGLRNDPKPITIQATQSGNTTSYVFDLPGACNYAFKAPVLVKPIPNMSYTVGQTLKQEDFNLGDYIVDPTQSQPHYFPNWSANVSGMPSGISTLPLSDLRYSLNVSLTGAPRVSGVYTVTVTAATQYFPSQPVTTTFTITVVDKPVTPPSGSQLKILSVAYSCNTGSIVFSPFDSDGKPITAPIVYSAPGVTRTSPTSNTGVVEQGLRNDPKPIVIEATYNGYTLSTTFDLKATCQLPGLLPPVAKPIPDLTLTTGKYLEQYTVSQYLRDPNPRRGVNYNPISFEAKGTPPGLFLYDATFIGDGEGYAYFTGRPTKSGTYSVTVTAYLFRSLGTGLSASSTFTITVVDSTVTPPSGSSLTLLAPSYDCATGAILFNTSGGDGSPIEFKSAGITDWTTNPNQFVDKDSRTANDVQPFMLMARQSGQVVSYSWNLKAACGRARVSTDEAGSGLAVKVLGNPIVGSSAEVEVSGVTGQTVQLKLLDLQGKTLHGHTIREAGFVERVSLPLGSAQGLLLLDVSTATQRQQIKLIRP